MIELQEKFQRKMVIEKERSNLKINKIDKILADHDDRINKIKANIPRVMSNELFGDLENQLDDRQKALTEGL